MGWINSDPGPSKAYKTFMPDDYEQWTNVGRRYEKGDFGKLFPQHCKAVVLDLDGTLLFPDGSIPPNAPRLLQALNRGGIPTILASARPPRSVLEIQMKLGLEGPVVALNGAWIGTRSTQLFSQPIPADVVSQIFQQLNTHKELQWNLYSRDKWYVRDQNSNELEKESKLMGFYPDGTTDPRETDKLLIIGDDGVLDLLRQSIRADRLPVEMYLSHAGHLEIVSSGVSKLSAVKSVLPHYGRALSEILAIGDGENDIELIAAVGHGVAMKTKSTALYAACDTMIGTNKQNAATSFLTGTFLEVLERVLESGIDERK